MPDPNLTGILSTENLINSPYSQGQTPPANAQPAPAAPAAPAPPPKPSKAQEIIYGALKAMAGPDASGKPRHGLGPMLGGILGGAMTGLAAGANREPGQAGGGLAAAGRGFQAVQQQQQQQKQRAFQNQQETDKMQLEKAANARAQQELIMRQHEMGRLDQQFQFEKDKFDQDKLNRLATLRVENNHIKDNLLKLKAQPVAGAPEAATDEELKQWAMKNMGAALGRFDTLPIQDLETGKWTLYEVPKEQEMTVHYGGKEYTVPVDPAILVKAAQDETKDNIEKVRAEADKLRAQAEATRAPIEAKEREQTLQERKDELAEKRRHNEATEGKTAGGQTASVKKTEPTVSQGIGNLLRGKDFSAPITTTTQTVRGAQPAVPAHIPAGATATNPATGEKIIMGGDGQWHPAQQQQ